MWFLVVGCCGGGGSRGRAQQTEVGETMFSLFWPKRWCCEQHRVDEFTISVVPLPIHSLRLLLCNRYNCNSYSVISGTNNSHHILFYTDRCRWWLGEPTTIALIPFNGFSHLYILARNCYICATVTAVTRNGFLFIPSTNLTIYLYYLFWELMKINMICQIITTEPILTFEMSV